jgi:hypothetical protein
MTDERAGTAARWRREFRDLRYELPKWVRAARRSWFSASGGLLWLASLLLLITVWWTAWKYQESQQELAILTSLKSALIFESLPVEARSAGVLAQATHDHLRNFTDMKASRFYERSIQALAALTISGSVLAAFIVALLTKVKSEVRLLDQAAAFAFLGATDSGQPQSLDTPVCIVLPEYAVRPCSHAQHDEAGEPGVGVEVLAGCGIWRVRDEMDFRFVVSLDSQAAERIRAKLKEVGFRNIRISHDRAEVVPGVQRAPIEILIGLRTNYLVEEALSSKRAVLFDISWVGGPTTHTVPPANQKLEWHIRLGKNVGNNWTPPSPQRASGSGTMEALLIAKMAGIAGTQIVVGGLSARGTLRCADVFCENLFQLDRMRDTRGVAIDHRHFALVYEYPKNAHESPLSRPECVVA